MPALSLAEGVQKAVQVDTRQEKIQLPKEQVNSSEGTEVEALEILFNQCRELNKQSQFNESLQICQQIITSYSGMLFDDVGLLLAAAYAIQTDNLIKLKRYEEALIALNISIKFLQQGKFSDDTTTEKAQYLIARGLLEKVRIFSELQRQDDEVTTYSEIINEFSHSKNSKIQLIVAAAYISQAYAFDELNRKHEALYNYNRVIQKYAEVIKKQAASGQTKIQELLVDAYIGRGYEYFLLAKQQWLIDHKKALQGLLLAQQDFIQAAKLTMVDETRAIIYGNEAYTFWLLGNEQQAEIKLKQALTLDGEYVYETTLEDIKQYPISQDAGFKALLEGLWISLKGK